MASKDKDILKWRNEGMAYGLHIYKEYGAEEFERQVKMRVPMGVSMKFTPGELDETIESITKNTYNLLLSLFYTALHDGFGFGKERLTKCRKLVEEMSFVADRFDPLGRHYISFEDYAEEANRLYDFQIDLDALKKVQELHEGNERKYVAIDALVRKFKQEGKEDLAEEFNKLLLEESKPVIGKKERLNAKSRQISDRMNKYYMDANEEENIEYWFNIFGLALSNLKNISADELIEIWTKADEINGEIADGTTTLSETKDKLLESCGINCNFTKGGY